MKEQTSPMWSILGQLVTWSLVVWGWAIVSELQDFRERRKDRLSRLGDLREQLSDVETAALEFHTGEFDGRKALEVQSRLGSVGRELAFLEACGYLEVEYQDVFIDLRQACTDKNFDKTSHSKRDHEDVICKSIMAARVQLEAVLIESQKTAATSESNPGRIVRRHLAQSLSYVRSKWPQRWTWNAEDDY